MNRNEWAEALIAAMGWLPSVRDGIVAQAYSEASEARCNPLDTTEPWPGASNYNAAGVKNYASTDDGLAATKATLLNGLYPAAVTAGQRGDAGAFVSAIGAGPWGTWSSAAQGQTVLLYVQAHPGAGLVEVAGTAPDPETEEALMPAVVTPDGKVKVYAVGAGTRAGQLLEFTRDPADPNANAVIDITAQIADPDPYTVSAL